MLEGGDTGKTRLGKNGGGNAGRLGSTRMLAKLIGHKKKNLVTWGNENRALR